MKSAMGIGRLGRRLAVGGAATIAAAILAMLPASAGAFRRSASTSSRVHVARLSGSGYLHRHKPPKGAARAPIEILHSHAHGAVYRTGSRAAALIRADCASSCVGPLFDFGGPVMRAPTVHPIFWEPESKEAGINEQKGPLEKFPSGYESEIDSFLAHVQEASSEPLGNVFSVDLLYGDSEGAGAYAWHFGGGLVDHAALPQRESSECPAASAEEEKNEKEGKPGLPPAEEPCITDAQLQAQLKSFVKEKVLPSGMGALYLVLTPPRLNSCAGGKGAAAECTTNSYCAYHSDVKGASRSEDIVYANMPYGDRAGCETPDQPNGNPADDEINLISHEGNEAITDPLGGEAEEEGTEPKIGWLAFSGNEVADLCTTPFFDDAIDVEEKLDAYGALLGGTPRDRIEGGVFYEGVAPGTAYNQVIAGGHYLLQREWSDAAEGCVAHAPVPEASFSVSSSPAITNEAITFDGAASSAGAGRLDYYHWEFGDGSSASGSASAEHAYSSPGTYDVTLTVANDSGAEVSTTQPLTVSLPPAPEVKEVTKTTAVTRTVDLPTTQPIAHYTMAGIAGSLRLPGNGRRLAALHGIDLGKATCPPACGLSIRILALMGAKRGKRAHNFKPVMIAKLKRNVAAGPASEIVVHLTAKGRKLLKRSHLLHVQVTIVVEGREGATWTLTRKLLLTSKAQAAARRKGHAARRGRHSRRRRR